MNKSINELFLGVIICLSKLKNHNIITVLKLHMNSRKVGLDDDQERDGDGNENRIFTLWHLPSSSSMLQWEDT